MTVLTAFDRQRLRDAIDTKKRQDIKDAHKRVYEPWRDEEPDAPKPEPKPRPAPKWQSTSVYLGTGLKRHLQRPNGQIVCGRQPDQVLKTPLPPTCLICLAKL